MAPVSVTLTFNSVAEMQAHFASAPATPAPAYTAPQAPVAAPVQPSYQPMTPPAPVAPTPAPQAAPAAPAAPVAQTLWTLQTVQPLMTPYAGKYTAAGLKAVFGKYGFPPALSQLNQDQLNTMGHHLSNMLPPQ